MILNDNYKIELDLFSGQQNPTYQISRSDFESALDEINELEESEPVQLFDGLGFRGIVLSGLNSVNIQMQNEYIRIQTLDDVKYFKSDPKVLLMAIQLFNNYDRDGKYKALIEKVIDEYL